MADHSKEKPLTYERHQIDFAISVKNTFDVGEDPSTYVSFNAVNFELSKVTDDGML